ncbi:MAG TPA: BON domain-containing protein [Anaeromyxobacteraceae bacterium]
MSDSKTVRAPDDPRTPLKALQQETELELGRAEAGDTGGVEHQTPAEAAAQATGSSARRGDEDDLSDEELAARVQAQVKIPAGVEVTAVEGAVVLFGRVPRFALAALLSRVARVPGVVDVEDRLTPVDDLGADEEG